MGTQEEFKHYKYDGFFTAHMYLGKDLDDVDNSDNGNYEIYIMNNDGENQRRLTWLEGQDTYPSMSPDNKEIVFESWQNGYPEIGKADKAVGSNASNVVGSDYAQPKKGKK